jgi:general secretion pathway protein C
MKGMQMKTVRAVLSLLIAGVVLGGCSMMPGLSSEGGAKRLKLSDYSKGGAERAIEVPMELERAEFKKLLAQNGSLRGIRFVPILHGKDEPSPGYPEYRVFGINPGSVYAKMGLENADILIAANGYVFDNPGKFPQYVSLLAEEQSGFVNIRRSGNSLQLSYTIK